MLKELFLTRKTQSYSRETLNILKLIRSENVGPRTFIALIKLFGNAESALDNIAEFSIRGGRTKPVKVFSDKDIEQELELLAKNDAALITYKSPEYSRLLLQIPDLPPVLTYKGNIQLLNHYKTVGIVGARNASMNGRLFASKMAKELAEQDYVIVSGLARGIDTAAHQAAVNKTIAVLAGGVDHIYPPENRKLYEQIASAGLLVAELPIGSKPLSQHFPQRNRLISGLSLGSVIIEAGVKSGSLITARLALEQNREVFAVPGFPLDPRSQGTNMLIKEGAHLVESVQDIISNLQIEEKLQKTLEDSSSSSNNFKLLGSNYINQVNDNMRREVTKLLSATPIDLDCLVKETNLPIQVIYTIVLELELAGNIIRYPGNKISLVYK